ncbi:MAG: 4Fe-4S dicluster domain-containing protein [Thermodesulfobacteriota bacterium]
MLDSAAVTQTVSRDTPKKVRAPRRRALILDWCTGCGGVPVCRVYCKFDALHLVADEENYPFRRMTVDAVRCVGCGACVSGGPDGLVLTGCPWNAIRLVPVPETPQKETTGNRDHDIII